MKEILLIATVILTANLIVCGLGIAQHKLDQQPTLTNEMFREHPERPASQQGIPATVLPQ